MEITNITKSTDSSGNPLVQAESTETVTNAVVYDLPTIQAGLDKAMADVTFWQSLLTIANGANVSTPQPDLAAAIKEATIV